MHKIKTFIISGFLGSGKTQLVKNIVSAYNEKRIVIIENEVAEFGVDGKISSANNVKVIEINDGCISDVNLNNLKRAINSSLARFKPEIIIIEASGAAGLEPVISMLGKFTQLELHCIAVIDALRFSKAKKLSTYTLEHIAKASAVILNKCDMVSVQEKNKQLRNVKLLNQNVIEAVKSEVDVRQLKMKAIIPEKGFKIKKSHYLFWKIRNNLGLKHSKKEQHSNINAYVYEAYGTADAVLLKRFFSKNKFPRAKGFVYLNDNKLYYFNVIDDYFEIQAAPKQHFKQGKLNRIVLIGENVYHKRRIYSRKLNKCLRKTLKNIFENIIWALKNQQTIPERVVIHD